MPAATTVYRRKRRVQPRRKFRRDSTPAALIAAMYVAPISMPVTVIFTPAVRLVGEPLATGIHRS